MAVDVTVASFEDMEPMFDGLARRARATLGVTGWGMQLMTLPANWDYRKDHQRLKAILEARSAA